ncbi:HlyD family type I secretion periplasmic adaptor subunit [Mesorhizobium sp. AR10]|uniref:HlyD family type I secretion periplasmic adaptor subunit n=1 Tax=Mesorhizobium sp. AR10 TaxID=2865839 RepID=UPI002160BC95|nr:HlyD family type I secretion periplasmic adaptor subunit [Mesorhizobium sp. AR10]UVK40979.1 HlyD family type I secretion periplasmic adaptor subunit [Mesorhizobium sp. AR10]
MADLVALLRNAINGLDDHSPAMRQKVYERARTAVAKKLALLNAPPSVSERTLRDLENAIWGVETELTFADSSNTRQAILCSSGTDDDRLQKSGTPAEQAYVLEITGLAGSRSSDHDAKSGAFGTDLSQESILGRGMACDRTARRAEIAREDGQIRRGKLIGMLGPDKRNRRSWTIRKPLGIGLAAMVGLFGLVFAWAATFNISGAVIGTGQVQASANRIAVQHQVGGVVAAILANNGDQVRSGDVVLRLDDSSLRSELATVEGELFEILANEARLEAVLDDRKELSLHPVLQEAVMTNPGLKPLLDHQQRQLDAHYDSLVTQVSLLREQTNQIRNEALGVQAALDAKREELAFSSDELAGSIQKLDKGLITKTIVTTLQKEVITAKGEFGTLTAQVAELNGKLAEQELKLNAIPLEIKDLGADKINLLRQQSKKLIEIRSSILHNLGNLDVRTPVSGMVFDSKILGPRSVIEAAKPIMYIVPDGEPTLVVVRVEGRDIDQVHIGQEAGLRFTTFNRRSTPIIEGRVTAISADAFLDERTQAFYYFVDVSLIEEELHKLGDVKLISGMPVEAFLTTKSRSPASYVIKPIFDYFARAFRD